MLSMRRPNKLSHRSPHRPLSTVLLSRILLLILVCFWDSNSDGAPIHCPIALLVNAPRHILRLPRDTSSAHAMYGPPTELITDGRHKRGLAVADAGGFMYWADYNTIKQTSLDGSNTKTLLTTEKYINKLIVEPVENKLYYTTESRVEKCELESGVRTTVVNSNSETGGLAVDRNSSLLFYATTSPIRIYKANLDGSDVTEIVSTGLSYVSSIAINYDKKRMCWTDRNNKHIACSDYFGHHRQVYKTTGEPMDLEIVNDVAYYVQTSPGSVVSMELTGGDRTTHDAGVRGQSFYDIAVVGASGDLNCRTSESHDKQLVESTDLEVDPPMSLVKSAQLVDFNKETCVALTSSAMYVHSVGLWNPQPRGKCWFPGISITRRVPEAIQASFTVTITGRRLVCSMSHFEVFLRRSKWSQCELSGVFHICILGKPATTGNEALITCAAKCECIGDDCGHVTINIQTFQESWELCEIGIK